MIVDCSSDIKVTFEDARPKILICVDDDIKIVAIEEIDEVELSRGQVGSTTDVVTRLGEAVGMLEGVHASFDVARCLAELMVRRKVESWVVLSVSVVLVSKMVLDASNIVAHSLEGGRDVVAWARVTNAVVEAEAEEELGSLGHREALEVAVTLAVPRSGEVGGGRHG